MSQRTWEDKIGDILREVEEDIIELVQAVEDDGYDDGYKEGKEQGYKEGYDAGYAQAQETVKDWYTPEPPERLED